jgi:hypothetical protein
MILCERGQPTFPINPDAAAGELLISINNQLPDQGPSTRMMHVASWTGANIH